jgi:hypothetical protein
MLRAVGLPFNLLFAALALALIRELAREVAREIVRWIAPLVFFLAPVVPFAAGFLFAAAAPAFPLFAAAFFVVESACAVSAAPPAAIRTTGHSSTLSSAIVRNLVLFPKRLAPKDIPPLQRPQAAANPAHTTTLSRMGRPVCAPRHREPPQTPAPTHSRLSNSPPQLPHAPPRITLH